jgi:hypothetical protein
MYFVELLKIRKKKKKPYSVCPSLQDLLRGMDDKQGEPF